MVSAVDRRRRFAKACDACRQKKLRCDGTRPVCSRCRDHAVGCHYADVNKPPSSRRRSAFPEPVETSQGSPDQVASTSGVVQTHIRGAEAGIQRGIMRQPPHRSDSFPHFGDAECTPTHRAQHPLHEEASTSSHSPLSQDTLVAGSRDLRYFGPSSGVSLVSAATPTPNQEHSTYNKPKVTPQEGNWSTWTHPALAGIFQRRVHRDLPPWSEALALVKEFFDEEHRALPLFHAPTFMILLGRQYSDDPLDNTAWWASLNAVLAIATRRRTEMSQCTSTESDVAWGYAANALDAVLDIMMRNTELISVQALLSLAWFFIGTPNPQPSFMLASSALRLAHSIGLHKGDCDSVRGSVEKETRNKVFWCALTLDRYICFRTGRPSAQDSSDFKVELPGTFIEDISDDLNMLHANTGLALLQESIYRKLYSSEALSRQPGPIPEIITKLDQQLQDWIATVTPVFNPREMPSKGSHPTLIRLYFTYYNCVVAVHRAHGRQYWMPVNIEGLPHPSSSISESIQRCSGAARLMAGLLDLIPPHWKSFCWDVLPFISTALVVLSINVLRKPNSNDAQDDLDAVEKMIQHLTTLKDERPGSYVPRLLTVCEQLYGMARRAMTPTGVLEAREVPQAVTPSSTFIPSGRPVTPTNHSCISDVGWEQSEDQFATIREMVGTSSLHPALRSAPQDYGYHIPNFLSTPDQMGQGFLSHLINPWSFDQLPDDLFMFDNGWNTDSQDNTSWG